MSAGLYLCAIASVITFAGGILLVRSKKIEVTPTNQIFNYHRRTKILR